jgi:TonB family protein
MRCAAILLLIICLDMPVTSEEMGNQAPPTGANAAGGRLVPTVDVQGFCCPDYLVLIANRIRVNWNDRVPAAGTTVLKVTIQQDGQIADSVVEQSSGDATLDLAAQRALALTREVPPLPSAYPNPTLTIHFTFEYGEPAGSLRAALRNLQRYNQRGDVGEFGPEIQFDTKGVEFGPWIRRFIAQVKRSWFIPYKAMSMKGHVVLTFNVQKDGTITDVEVRTPSGVDEFNNAARGAVIASNPTQPLPREYPAEKAFFTVTFYYNEVPPQSERTFQGSADLPLPDKPASLLLKGSAADVEQRLGKPSQIDGRRWMYKTSGGTLAVYFDDADVVIDVQPRAFDLSIFEK